MSAALDAYAGGLRWMLERKDLNDFWPVGLPLAGRALGDRLVTTVEALLDPAAPVARVPNPTAVLMLAFFSTHGMRLAEWPRERRVAYATALLDVVRNSRVSPLGDPTGAYRLHGWAAPAERAWQPASSERLRAVSSLCALAWACSEALYFCNHRIGTERHGPYPAAGDATMLVVRSIHDLAPRELWPEVTVWPELPRRIEVISECEARPLRFDMFANPLFEYDVHAATRRVAVVAECGAGWEPVTGLDELGRWTRALRELVTRVSGLVDAMSIASRCLRLHNVMLYASRAVTRRPAALEGALTPQPGGEVRGSVDALLRYYDLRQDWP